MNDRQFLRGLSGGVTVFAIAGAFWFGLGFSTLPGNTGWPVWALMTLIQAGFCAGLIWAAVRLRRRSESKRSESREQEDRRRAETRHVLSRFVWVSVGQALFVACVVIWCLRKHADEMIWPSIALIVSLHFVPLARLFHVRAYYVTATAGSILSLAVLAGLAAPHSVILLADGMAAVMWLSAVYLLVRADRIAAWALREPWIAGNL